MKIINLDELDLKCIEFGLKNNIFTKEDLKKENLFTVSLQSRYHSKTCDIWFANEDEDIEIKFTSETWENLYYQLDRFFSETWNYFDDNSKMPLYMKIAELIGRQSKNGFINASKINEEIRKLL